MIKMTRKPAFFFYKLHKYSFGELFFDFALFLCRQLHVINNTYSEKFNL